jgi:LysM repeat protein
MPVATIGLFALAFVVIALAFVIQQVVGDGNGGAISPADAVATRDAINRTATAQAALGTPTPTPPAQTPQATPTPGTPPPGTPTPAPNGRPTYTVAEGDTCYSIARDHEVTLAALLQANNLTEDDCTRLAVGRELRIP